MKTKLILTCLLLVAIGENLKSCICRELPEYNTYSYIALVEVEDLKRNGANYNIEFNTIEQIKGPKITTCTVLSNHPALTDIGTSCDLIINSKEQCIICGNGTKNEIQVWYCSKTKMYRSEIGELTPNYCKVDNSLEILRTMYGINQNKKAEGKYQTFYDNGRIEIEEYYSNGQLNGERYVYYKNGSLMLYQCFSNGIKEENEYKWSRNEKLKYENEYIEGKSQHYKYYKSDTLDFEVILQEDGKYERIHHNENIRLMNEKLNK